MPASTSIASSTAVELSRLPAPEIVESLDFETILAARLAGFQAAYPEHDALVESDPVFKLLEVAAYQELNLRQRINEAAAACMVAYALGADLDNLAAIFGVARLEVTPADEQAEPDKQTVALQSADGLRPPKRCRLPVRQSLTVWIHT